MEINIPILSGTFFDLSLFDFSFNDIRIYDIQSSAFKDYIVNLRPAPEGANFTFVKHIIEGIHSENNKKYAIVKNDPHLEYNYQDIINVWRLLLIIFPSDLQIEHIIHYENLGQVQNSYMSTWPKRFTGEYPGEPLFSSEKYVPEINEFSKKYFNFLNRDNYIGIAIENYITSFSASHDLYQYLTLCIALESIISVNQELSYRLKRSVAILCGESELNCDIIFENLTKIYNLRSKIVHGAKYNKEKVTEYLEYLKAIVSRTIIELLIHNLQKNEELDKTITRLAFGERGKISTNWKSYILHPTTFAKSNCISLDK